MKPLNFADFQNDADVRERTKDTDVDEKTVDEDNIEEQNTN